MKKLLTAISALLVTCSLRADVVFTETFNYVDGALNFVSTNTPGVTNWFRHSGTGNDALIRGQKLQVGMNRQDDVNRPFNSYTNSVTNLYASFIVNCTNLPTASNYFAHFYVNTTTFHGRVWNAPGSVPGTWRLGVTTASTTLGIIRFFPVDLATNTDYQVVVNWNTIDGINAIGNIWVNAISSSDPVTSAIDVVTPAPAPSVAFAFRQPGAANGANTFNISKLVVATTFDEAATNTLSTNAVPPVFLIQPKTETNFPGVSIQLYGVATGQGLGNLLYTWLKDGSIYSTPNNTNLLDFPNIQETDSGLYQLVATTPYGLSATSSVANLWITNPPVPPVLITQPASTTTASGGNVTLVSYAVGPQPLSYQWSHAGTNLPGATDPTLLLTNVRTNNGNTGAYFVGITNTYGGVVSTNAIVIATNPPQVSIAYIRTLVDGSFVPLNGTALWSVTGTVTTFTNQTSANTSSYYLQDATAGINIFITLGSTFRPALGDVLTFVGFLSTFQGTLELVADASNPSTSYTVLSNNLASLPAPRVIGFLPNVNTNNSPVGEALEGSLVMLTNVYFGTNAGLTISNTANALYVVTNINGQTFHINFSQQDLDTSGQILPAFAYSVRGPLTQATNTHAGYQVTVTKFSDIVTDAPPAVTLSVATVGKTRALTWAAEPHKYSYSVLSATNVNGPYVPELRYEAVLKAVNENPALTTKAVGFGTVAISPDLTTVTVNERWEGIAAPASASHIHGPAILTQNASVLIGFPTVPAVTTGAIPEQTLSMGAATNYSFFTNSLMYMNVHNATYGGGEIRGQIYRQPSIGLSFSTTNGFYSDVNTFATNKFYKVVSP
jgi:hypothetical protein